MLDIVNKFSCADYVALLPSSTRDQVTSAIDNGLDAMVVAQNLASEPAAGLATKGGAFWPPDLLRSIVRELHALLCTEEPRYSSWRSRLQGEGAASAKALVLLVSSAIAASVGILPAMCVPFVALVLASAMKVGTNAWCEATAKNLAGPPRVESTSPPNR